MEYLPLNVSPHLEPEGAIYLLTSSTLHPEEGRKQFCNLLRFWENNLSFLQVTVERALWCSLCYCPAHCVSLLHYRVLLLWVAKAVLWYCMLHGAPCSMHCTPCHDCFVRFWKVMSMHFCNTLERKRKEKKITSLWFYVRWFQAGQALTKESASSNKNEFNFSPLWFVVWLRTFVTSLRILSKQCVTACWLRSQKRSRWF